MRLHRIHMLALGMSLISSAAFAQTPFGHTFCGLYKQAAEQGLQAFADLRGKQIADGRWEVKDVTVPGGRCIIRADIKEGEMLTCAIRQASLDDAKLWAVDMTKASRECLTALGGFTEQSKKGQGKGGEVERTVWVRKTDAGPLNISLMTIARDDGEAQNRMQIRQSDKE